MNDRPATYFLETLGCPKNQVDSDKLEGTLAGDGMRRVDSADEADMEMEDSKPRRGRFTGNVVVTIFEAPAGIELILEQPDDREAKQAERPAVDVRLSEKCG